MRKFSCLFHVQFQCLYILAVGSYHNLEVARFYHVLQICVVELEHIWCDFKTYLFAFANSKMNALEPFQLLYRARDACHHIADVELYYFVGIAISCVLNGDSGGYIFAILPLCSFLVAIDVCFLAAQAEVAIFESGIAQTVTERIERTIAYIEAVACKFGKLLVVVSYRTTGV